MAARQLQAAYDYDYLYDYGAYAPEWEPEITKEPEKKEERSVINTALRSKVAKLVIMLSFMATITAVGNQLIASRGYALVQAKQEAERLETENEHLKVDIAKLKSPQRIKDIAINNLGMVVPKDVYFATEKK